MAQRKSVAVYVKSMTCWISNGSEIKPSRIAGWWQSAREHDFLFQADVADLGQAGLDALFDHRRCCSVQKTMTSKLAWSSVYCCRLLIMVPSLGSISASSRAWFTSSVMGLQACRNHISNSGGSENSHSLVDRFSLANPEIIAKWRQIWI